MKIKRLYIKNHSRLGHDLDIEVRGHLVLVGPNDSGKSSVVRCLDLLLGAAPEELPLRITRSDFLDTSQSFVVRCTMGDLGGRQLALFGNAVHANGKYDTQVVNMELSCSIMPTGQIQILRSIVVKDDFGAPMRLPITDDQLACINWRFASSERRSMSQTPSPEESTVIRFRQIHGLAMPGDSYLNTAVSSIHLAKDAKKISASYRSVDNTMKQSRELTALRADIAESLSQISPRHVKKEDLSFVYTGLPENMLNPMEGVHLQIDTGDMRSERSEVMETIAQFVLAMRGADILTIDEPELHLHPSSQRSLAKMLAAQDAQCIISTHSADIVSAFDPDCIVTMKKGVARQLREGALDNDARVRMKLWTHDRLEPLTADKLILVEGITDRLIVQRVAEMTGRDLDRFGVSLVQTDGVGKMIPFDKLFGPEGFDVPIFRLIDKDAVENMAKKLDVPVQQLSSKHVYVSQCDLEEEYVKGLTAGFVWKAMSEGDNFSKAEIDAWQRKWNNKQTPTKQQVADFCRANNNKVPACMSVLDVLTPANAGKIKSINALLDAVVGPARGGAGDGVAVGVGVAGGVGAGSAAAQEHDDIVAAMTRPAVALSHASKNAAVPDDSEPAEAAAAADGTKAIDEVKVDGETRATPKKPTPKKPAVQPQKKSSPKNQAPKSQAPKASVQKKQLQQKSTRKKQPRKNPTPMK